MGEKRSKGYATKKAYELLMYDRGKIDKKPAMPRSRSLRGSIRSRYKKLKEQMKNKGFGDYYPGDKVIRKKVKSLFNRKLNKKYRFVVKYELKYPVMDEDDQQWYGPYFYSGTSVQTVPELLLTVLNRIKKQLKIIYEDETSISESPEIGIYSSYQINRDEWFSHEKIIELYEDMVNQKWDLKRSVERWNLLLKQVRSDYNQNENESYYEDLELMIYRYQWYG